MPISVSPRARIIGIASASSARAATSTRPSRRSTVGSVCDRVTREKSSKRSRSTTVRPTRSAARIRRVTRSTRPTRPRRGRGGCGDRPSARWAPIERRRAAAGRGADRGCGPARAGGGPTPRRAAPTSVASSSRATWPTVVTPCACSLRAVPCRRPTAARPAAGAGTPARRSGGTTSSPSGFATPLATLARNFVRATPTVIGSPTSVANVVAQPRGDLARRAGDPLHARAHRGTPRRSTGPRRPATCRRRPRRRPCWPPSRRRIRGGTTTASRAQRLAPAAAHRRRTPQRLCLVAGGQHDAAADDHRAARAGADRHAAPPTRRTRRGRRGGWWPAPDTNTCSHMEQAPGISRRGSASC